MVKPRENRVPIMMSDDELKAVDDWRYANRVATRSDAIRRLAQIAIKYCAHIDAIDISILNLFKIKDRIVSEIRDGKLTSDEIFRNGFQLLLDGSSVAEDEIIKLFQATRPLIPSEYDDGKEKGINEAIWETNLAMELEEFIAMGSASSNSPKKP